MDRRHHSYDAGSSRSARDDSRKPYHAERSERSRDYGRERQRSRSPRRRASPGRRSPERRDKYRDRSPVERFSRHHDDERKSPKRYIDEDEEVPAPPPPPRITKISIELNKPAAKVAPIKMSLGGPSKAPARAPLTSVFGADEDDEPEEMPAEARMRMRNIGRETPTSAGPNSFGKTKQGFCDSKKVFEKNLKQALEMEDTQKTQTTKFPQTIYKLKGP